MSVIDQLIDQLIVSAASFSPVSSIFCCALEQQSYMWKTVLLRNCVLGCLWAGEVLLCVLCRVVF